MKRNLQINRPKISSEEIAKHRDFDQLLNQYQTANRPFYKKSWFLTGMAAVVIVAGIVLYNTTDNQPDKLAQSKEHPFVNPPLKGLNIPHESFLINAEEASEIQKSNGTKIKIPANAFVDEDGEVVKGEVLIKYREFHDQVEIMLSGIPMKYDSAGVEYQFVSAGMMEILGYKNGRPIFVKEDKTLNVSMASFQDGNEYNLYYLDTVQRNWVNKGSNTITRLEESEKELPKKEQIQQVADNMPIMIDEVVVKEPIKPLPPRKKEGDAPVFVIDLLPKEFPELADYNGAIFQVDEGKSEFSEAYYKVEWEDLDLKKLDPGTDEYLMTVSKGKTTKKIYVVPVFEGKDYEDAKKVFDKKYIEYRHKLADKIAMEKRLKEQREKELAEIKEKRKREIRKQRTSDSLSILAIEQENMAIENGEVLLAQNTLFRNFSISGFGIYNCDTPMPLNGQTYNAQFVLDNNNGVDAVVKIINKNINTVYDIGMPGSIQRPLRLNIDTKYVAFAFIDQNKVAVCKELKSPVNPYEKDIKVHLKVQADLKTVKDFKNFVKI